MGRKWFLVCAVSAVLLYVPGCGRDQELTSIAIQPTTETFGAANIPVIDNAGAQVQLRAIGSYIHPPVTKDITDQVTWASNTPQMVTVDSTGMITATGNVCGGTLVSATVKTNSSAGGIKSSGSIVTGYMTANVVCFTGTGSGSGGTSTLSVAFVGTGSGTVTSSPTGLSCAGNCTASFASGSTVTLTATPGGTSAFGQWVGCDSMVGPTCTVQNLQGARSVAVTFN